ncbi:MAG: hypothetical protein CME70_05390 [Halobacteriovorax sp.]|nr:hypothetical protein [Halobacteriovorax sp.]|tara:strand:+ start:55983 stop:56843 length:861 start_codon:yes stop_codon:yes gene_type:complete
MKKFVLIVILFSLCASAEDKKKSHLDFDSIKSVLKNDFLTEEARKNRKQELELDKAKLAKKKGQYNAPDRSDFWTFFTEYWLVKNATILKWDFEKPDYALDDSFKFFLEKLGYYEKTFRILLVNTPNITHFALPSDPNEYLFIISVPFIRTLDLTKLEISLLLFEDMLRADNGYFVQYVSSDDLRQLVGKNFFDKKKINLKTLKNLSTKYDEIIFDKGFNFQQQFAITKKMDHILKTDLQLWNMYYKMLQKIDDLVKSNVLYKKYNQIYPSPELQMNWLRPKKTIQ